LERVCWDVRDYFVAGWQREVSWNRIKATEKPELLAPQYGAKFGLLFFPRRQGFRTRWFPCGQRSQGTLVAN
jgi:hypothetical protein